MNVASNEVDGCLGKLNGYKDELTDSNKMRALLKLASSLKLTQDASENAHEWYYGVYIPHDVRLQNGEEPTHVYTVKEEALKVMKLSKRARFKQFKTRQEACEFAEHGAEIIPNSTPTQGIEKQSSFKGPKQQAIVQFKKAIDSGDIEAVRLAINENPRYLVSNGDTPSILQEGCRYNALHIASRKNQAAIIELILSSVTSLELLARLYDEADENALRERSTVLLDLYLNTPDKGSNDTPLHIACKFGSVDVVDLLMSYPECRRDLVNKYNETPKDVICSRVENHEAKKRILDLLEEKFFLPVLRSEDNSMQPRIGDPFSPEVKSSPLSPRIEIQAYAGPMSKNQIKEFRKIWRTPPALLKSSAPRFSDPEKGLERVGRHIAHSLQIPWREYWPFLNTFVDLSSQEGLQLLEKYFEDRFNETLNESINENEPEAIKNEEETSPMSYLCKALESCSLTETHSQRPLRVNTKKLRREKSFLARTDEIAEEIADGQKQFSPLLCVERSCKVFGNRIANAMICLSTSDPSNVAIEIFRDNLETEVRHLQTLITRYLEDVRFQSVDFNIVHRRVAAIAVNGLKSLLTSELTFLTRCLRDISTADGIMSDDEDYRMSYRPNPKNLLRAVLKSHFLCMTECLLVELKFPAKQSNLVQNESECDILWNCTSRCNCQWSADSDIIKSRLPFRRQQKIIPKILHFKNDDESSIEESWRSCDDDLQIDDEKFVTPPSSPLPDEPLEDSFSIPDTFINGSDKPTKMDLAVLEAIKECNITAESHPNIYRWRHLVQLHQENFVNQISSPRISRLAPRTLSTPNRAQWERVTGLFSPRRFAASPR